MKKILMFIIFLIVVGGIFLTVIFNREKDGIPILLYHQVNDVDKNQLTVPVSEFEEQIKYLVDNGYSFITPDEMLNAWESEDGSITLPDKPVIITFDDGYIDTYKNVYPILQQYNARITQFVVTDYVNLYPNYLTWDQAREMQASGLVDIESHTLSHFNLVDNRLSNHEVQNQIFGSKQAVEWFMKKPAKYIAYPGGEYTREAAELTQQIGYRAAFAVDYGLAHKEPQHFILPRIPIFGNNSYSMLRFKIRLRLAPIIAPIYRLKNEMISDGNGVVAQFIWIP